MEGGIRGGKVHILHPLPIFLFNDLEPRVLFPPSDGSVFFFVLWQVPFKLRGSYRGAFGTTRR
jgi:hypothetical protein